MKKNFHEISNNILLSNLIKIRWIAIIGQLFAIIISFLYLSISLPILSCLTIIFISILVNFFSYLTKKGNNYLKDNEAFYFLLFDTLQLGFLLYLTGGIYNPFSLLIIAPLIISASYLRMVFSIVLSFLSVVIVIVISNFYIPINWNNSFNVPDYFKYGLSVSLIISIIFITIYVYLFASSSRGISQALSQTRSALENQKKISEIGSLSAAAVHELSTPLNTIFLVLDDLREQKFIKQNIEIRKEIELLKSQAERCKSILLTLSKSPENLKDSFINNTTLSNIIKLTFDKFNYKKIKLNININYKIDEPKILIKDELVYALGNIIQNSIQHAKQLVEIDIFWKSDQYKIIITDDGMGFSRDILDRIGNPYISKNNKGMGLGIYIAINLIENLQGKIKFTNKQLGGGSVEIVVKHDS